MTHKFGNWRYLVLNGIVRKKAIDHPTRRSVLLQKALSKYKYRVAVPFINPYWHGHRGDAPIAIQWLDFCVWSGKKMFVVLFDLHGNRRSGILKRERETLQAKLNYLVDKRIPYLVVRRDHTSQEYDLLIRTFLRKENL